MSPPHSQITGAHSGPPPTGHSGPGLVRRLKRWDLVALVLNAIIGAGIFGLPATAFQRTGAYSLVAYAVCAILVALIALCFAEVASRFTGTGGPYAYARVGMGAFAGFQVGWLLWLARITAFASLSNLFVSYLSIFWPAAAAGTGRTIVLTCIVAVLTLVNLLGVRPSAIFTNTFTIGKLLPLLVFIGVGLFFVAPENFDMEAVPSIGDFRGTVLILVFAFSGFEMAVIPAGEIVDPKRHLPFALMTGIGIVVVLYILIQFVAIGTLPTLAESGRPIADASERFLGPAGARFIAIGALVSIMGTLNTIALITPRLLYAIAEERQMPRVFAAVHNRFRTPYVSIIVSSAVILWVTLAGSFVASAAISTVIRLIVYGSTCLAFLRLRRIEDAPPASFTAPAGLVAATAALALIAWVLLSTPFEQFRDTSIAIGVGVLLFLVFRGFYPHGSRD